MKTDKKFSVVRDGEVVAVGTKAQADGYAKKLGGDVRKYCGPIGKKVKQKRPPINPVLPSGNKITKEGAVAAVAKDPANRKSYVHLSKDGTGKVVVTDKPPKDQFFKTPAEGRPKLAIPVRPKPVKMKDQLWNGHTMVNFFRVNQINAASTNWIVLFNTPHRKMTPEDQLELMLAHSDTEYLVQINEQKKYLIIDNLKGHDDYLFR